VFGVRRYLQAAWSPRRLLTSIGRALALSAVPSRGGRRAKKESSLAMTDRGHLLIGLWNALLIEFVIGYGLYLAYLWARG
jgi:hypothetical protein